MTISKIVVFNMNNKKIYEVLILRIHWKLFLFLYLNVKRTLLCPHINVTTNIAMCGRTIKPNSIIENFRQTFSDELIVSLKIYLFGAHTFKKNL